MTTKESSVRLSLLRYCRKHHILNIFYPPWVSPPSIISFIISLNASATTYKVASWFLLGAAVFVKRLCDYRLTILKRLPLGKLSHFLLQICPKLCYFIHEYACFRLEMSDVSVKMAKQPNDSGSTAPLLSFRALHCRIYPRSFQLLELPQTLLFHKRLFMFY